MIPEKHYRLISILIVFLFAILISLSSYQGVFAQEPKNPNECPPGQEKQNGCKWVQHRITGNCMWLPEQAVAWPWEEVSPEGYCPPLETPTATATREIPHTATATATATATREGQPTFTATATATATRVGEHTATPTKPGKHTPTATHKPATPVPHPRPPHPGGPGNLGYILAGTAVGLGALAASGFLWRRFGSRKRI